jgi:hypothetical protein
MVDGADDGSGPDYRGVVTLIDAKNGLRSYFPRHWARESQIAKLDLVFQCHPKILPLPRLG